MNSPATPTPALVILAAGLSVRLGAPKALARVRGMSLLRRTVAILAPFAPAVIAVIPPRSIRIQLEGRGLTVDYAVNGRRATGLASSVRCAIRHSRGAPAVLLVPVDLAALDRRDIAALLSRWRGARRRLVARRVEFGRGATPLILPRWLFKSAMQIRGDVGLRDWLRQLTPAHCTLLELRSAAADVDTPQDLRAARRRVRVQPQIPVVCTRR